MSLSDAQRRALEMSDGIGTVARVFTDAGGVLIDLKKFGLVDEVGDVPGHIWVRLNDAGRAALQDGAGRGQG